VYAGAALICVITMTAFVFALDVLLVKGLFRLFG
jgi:preprotein translocase subunit SecE